MTSKNTASLVSALGLLLAAAPLAAQVPERHLVASSFSYGGFAGGGGLRFVDTVPPHAVTPVTGLPCELLGTCAGSVGTNCVYRDPRTGDLITGNVANAGGAVHAYVLRLNGANVSSVISVYLGTVVNLMGVNAVHVLRDGDILLANGNIQTGPTAFQPLVRWRPSTGALMPVPLNQFYAGNNLCNALAVTSDERTAIVACFAGWVGNRQQTDIVAVPVSGVGSLRVIASLPIDEFVTQFAWRCDGQLIASTAQYPLGSGGRVLSFAEQNGSWVQTSSTIYPGLLDYNGACVDRASCTTYLNPNVFSGPTPSSDVCAIAAGGNPVRLSSGPAGGWGVVSGLDINPCPEVTELPTPAPNGFTSRWAYAPFPGGQSMPGTTFHMRVDTGANAAATGAFLGTGRVIPTAAPGLQLYLDFAAPLWHLGTLPGANPTFALPIPNVRALVGLELFGQAASVDTAGAVAATDLLIFTIGC